MSELFHDLLIGRRILVVGTSNEQLRTYADNITRQAMSHIKLDHIRFQIRDILSNGVAQLWSAENHIHDLAGISIDGLYFLPGTDSGKIVGSVYTPPKLGGAERDYLMSRLRSTDKESLLIRYILEE